MKENTMTNTGSAFYSSSSAVAEHLEQADRELIIRYNSTYSDIPFMTVREMLENSFEKYHDKTAVSEDNSAVTYAQLKSKSEAVAAKLEEMGAAEGDIIAVKAEKNIDTIAAAVGIMMKGYVYLPIHPSYPEEKKRHILESCGCSFFCEGTEIKNTGVTGHSHDKQLPQIPSQRMAYIIYTSGSTGLPKGVAISGQSVCNTVLDINQRFNVNENDRIIGLSALTFDLSIYDILGSLQCGGELSLVKDQRDIRSILEKLRNNNITLWNSVPAIMEMTLMAADSSEKFESMRNILLSGDNIPVTLPQKIKQFFPNADIYSLGGATEGSVWSIYYPIKDITSHELRVPYGIPLANQTMTVRDENMQICPVGTEGEICIGGRGVAMCYYNDPEKTAASFVQADEGIIYRTGDRGVMNEKGYMDFLGRMDSQVKLNGYRIETGEVESAALKNTDIDAASAFIYSNEVSGSKLLALCYTSKKDLDEDNIRNGLKEHLVDYMMPHIITKVDEIPLTSNGKVDNKALCGMLDQMSETEEEEQLDEFEAKIAEIWKDILGVKKVGRKSNFFSSGGDSLKAMRMIEALEKEGMIDHNISVADIFSVSDLGSLVNRLKAAAIEKQQQEENMEEGEL